MDNSAPLILLAAGGTGGHLFPAEALGVELIRRGFRVRLATDDRALRYSGLFSKDTIDVVPSATFRGRMPWQLAWTGMMLAAGTACVAQSDAALAACGGGRLRRLSDGAAFGGGAAVRHARHFARSQCGARPRQPFSVRSRQRDRDLAARRARSRSGAGRQDNHRRHADAPGDPRRRRGEICFARTGRTASFAGGRRQPGRAGDGRYRAAGDRAAGTGAVEPVGSDPAGARRRYGAGARGL